MKLDGRISTSLRYVIETTGLNPVILWELEGKIHSEKFEKMRYL